MFFKKFYVTYEHWAVEFVF